MEQIELRVLSSGLDVNDDEMIVEGLVNEVGNWSHTLGSVKKFKEKINIGAFDDAIRSSDRIDFLAEHKPNLLLATTENNSLELWEDGEGLKMRAKIAPTSYGKDFYTLIKHKMISHMSFGFKVIKDNWKKNVDGIYERSIDKLAIKEVSIVRNPAYPASTIAARGLELVEDVDIPEDIDNIIDNDDIEERNIDIDALKADIVKDVLDGIKLTINELNTQNIIKENTDIDKQDNITKDITTEVIEEIKPDIIQETTIEVTQDIVQETVQEVNNVVEEITTDILPEKDNIVDNTVGIIDLLDKYKELQSLK